MLDRKGNPVTPIGEGWRPVEVNAPAPPLTAAEQAEAGQAARRLHGELRGAIALLPAAQRGASAMSRALKIDRVTCQRIVSVAAQHEAGARTLVQLPGVQGLRQFVTALSRRRGARAQAEQIAGLAAAVDHFDAVIDQLGGSQRRLRSRLGLDGAPAPVSAAARGGDEEAAREALFHGATAVTGRWSETALDIRIVRPVPGEPLYTEGARVRGLIGHSWRVDAVPLELWESAPLRAVGGPGPAFTTLDARLVTGNTPGSLIPEFCSTPLPRVTSRSAGERAIHVIDAPDSGANRPVDIFMAHKAATPDRHPATLRPPVGEMGHLITFPAVRLVFDVYLHRDIARRCIPSLEVHLARPGEPSRWSTRFPGGPRLQLLGPGAGTAASAAYPRHQELVRHVIDQVGWDPAEFVGYRCESSYPIWRAAYTMLFDFTGNELEEPGAPAQVSAWSKSADMRGA
jgi:hypothetical protein